ncbi:MAG: hypothetical protein K2X93_28815 [Candidatus Obscuribacterales bacterium]|nr:hypothetical protein [Candidatus Obscuribacterales bacterium]
MSSERREVVAPVEPQTSFAPPCVEVEASRARDKAARLFFASMTEFDLQVDDSLNKQIALLEEAAYLYSIDGGGPAEADVNRVLGDLLMASGRFVEALVPLTRACALDEFYADLTPSCSTLTNLGCSYFSLAEAQSQSDMSQKSGHLYEKAAGTLRLAIKQSRGVRDVHCLLAIARIIEQARHEDRLNRIDGANSQAAHFPGSSRARTFVGVKKMLKVALQHNGVVS